MHWINYYNNPN